jgi:DNA-binding PadR family transcriptional regulator
VPLPCNRTIPLPSATAPQDLCQIPKLADIQEQIHGAWKSEELARHDYQISPGTLYPTLHPLEADGLLVSEQRVVDGRVRCVYWATEAGKQGFPQDRKALRKLAREVLVDGAP